MPELPLKATVTSWSVPDGTQLTTIPSPNLACLTRSPDFRGASPVGSAPAPSPDGGLAPSGVTALRRPAIASEDTSF